MEKTSDSGEWVTFEDFIGEQDSNVEQPGRCWHMLLPQFGRKHVIDVEYQENLESRRSMQGKYVYDGEV
jgi:hypothetical protein